MSSGVAHEAVALGVLWSGAAALFLLSSGNDPVIQPDYALAMGMGLMNGFLITPDIDMDGRTREERRWELIPIVGGVISYLFTVWWYPYARFFKHSRHSKKSTFRRLFLPQEWSHLWLIGTGTRYLYQFFTLWFIAATSTLWINAADGSISYWLPIDQPSLFTTAAAFYFAGWLIQDTFHLLADGEILKWLTPGQSRGRRTKKTTKLFQRILAGSFFLMIILWVFSHFDAIAAMFWP